MQICTKCLNNRWTIRKVEGYIIAQCVICTHEVIFKAYSRKKSPKFNKVKKVKRIRKQNNIIKGIEAQKEETESIRRRMMLKQALGLKHEAI